MRHFAGPLRRASTIHIAKNNGAIAELKLGSVVLTNLYAFDEPERIGQPCHGGPHI